VSSVNLEQIDLASFELFVEDYGCTKYADVPTHLFNQYAGVLPDYMLAIWQRYGFTHHANGFFWIVNPNDYTELLDFLFGKDHGMTVFGRTTFGQMQAIRNDGKKFSISAQTGRAGSVGESPIEYTFSALILDDRDPRYTDHIAALKKLGLPSVEEIYGYVPALALGGAGTLEETQIVGMHEYLLMVAELAIELNKSGWNPFANDES
jgi:hypothetical protein